MPMVALAVGVVVVVVWRRMGFVVVAANVKAGVVKAVWAPAVSAAPVLLLGHDAQCSCDCFSLYAEEVMCLRTYV